MAEITPMMKQYLEIKEQNKDSILFFRLGDFYEMFNEDAQLASRELDLTLTTRDRGKAAEDQTPMCGIPYHSSDAYIARLIAKGYKVAICEQTEDPALAKGLVKRDIIRVITPGTVIDSACLDDRRGNFLCGIFLDGQNAGAAFCDMTTGHTHVTAFSGDERAEHLYNELSRFSPAEAVLSAGAYDNGELVEYLRDKLSCAVERGENRFELKACEKAIRAQFGEEHFASLPRNNPAASLALGALLSYLHETQKTDLSYIKDLEYYEQGRFMELDLSARRNLELTETIRAKEKRGSLLWVLDKTKTAMGARNLRAWLTRPLRDVAAIERRLGAVEALTKNTVAREELILSLSGISDMERLIGRIAYGTAGGRDFASLRNSIERITEVKAQLTAFTTGRLHELDNELDTLTDVAQSIRDTLVDEPPFSVREGGFIRKGFNAEVDRLHEILSGGKGLLADIETREKEKTGIRTLKIGYNRVFGYYIEVSRSFSNQVPANFVRKQTLANAERYITEDLKVLENKILGANERLAVLERQLFDDLLHKISAELPRIQKTASGVARLDVLTALAEVAVKNGYTKPVVDEGDELIIEEGRHPVIEQMLKGALFVPNDTVLDCGDNRMLIITGPNMAGKSTYMRQTALIARMAQIGSFVPARACRMGVVDAIFTRVGASDDLAAGQSTFMVEMTEVAEILQYATAKSLVILDEIGRGTSTFDGMSIARAVVEHIADKDGGMGCKTLFATHYHELTDLENAIDGVKNYNIAVKKRGDDITFLRRIVRGPADDSYGIEVAKLAGLPGEVTKRAKEVLKVLEATAPNADKVTQLDFGNFEKFAAAPVPSELVDKLTAVDVETLTPLEALNFLYELKQTLVK